MVILCTLCDRLATALLDYGERIQESVFLAHLDDELYTRMMDRIPKLIDPALDCVHIFSLCNACEKKARLLGKGKMPEDRPFVII